jgi:hypothetical protein
VKEAEKKYEDDTGFTASVDRARASIKAETDEEWLRKARGHFDLVHFMADLSGPHEVTIFGMPGKGLSIFNSPEEVAKGTSGGARRTGTYSNGTILNIIEAVPIKWEPSDILGTFPTVHALKVELGGWVKSRDSSGNRTVKKSFRFVDPWHEKAMNAQWREFVGESDEGNLAELAEQLEGSQAVVALLASKGVKFGSGGTAAGTQGVTARRPPLPGKSSGRRGGGTPPRRKKTKKRRKQSRRKTRGKRVGRKPRTRRS